MSVLVIYTVVQYKYKSCYLTQSKKKLLLYDSNQQFPEGKVGSRNQNNNTMCVAFLANLTSSTGNIDLTKYNCFQLVIIQRTNVICPMRNFDPCKKWNIQYLLYLTKYFHGNIYVGYIIEYAEYISIWQCNLLIHTYIYYLLGKKTILDHILSLGINLKFKVLTIFYHSII